MSDQIRISDTGELESVPTTWDGEPLYSVETVTEQPGLFSVQAFEQMRGQMALEPAPIHCEQPYNLVRCACCRQDFLSHTSWINDPYCSDCMAADDER